MATVGFKGLTGDSAIAEGPLISSTLYWTLSKLMSAVGQYKMHWFK